MEDGAFKDVKKNQVMKSVTFDIVSICVISFKFLSNFFLQESNSTDESVDNKQSRKRRDTENTILVSKLLRIVKSPNSS